MPEVLVETYVDVDLDDFDTEDLIDELERRGRGLEMADTSGTELVEKIFELRRVGKNFDKELDQLIYVVTGRIL